MNVPKRIFTISVILFGIVKKKDINKHYQVKIWTHSEITMFFF